MSKYKISNTENTSEKNNYLLGEIFIINLSVINELTIALQKHEFFNIMA